MRILGDPPDPQRQPQTRSHPHRILEALLRGDATRPSEDGAGFRAEAVAAQVEAVSHQTGGKRQAEISRLGRGMEGQTHRLPGGDLLDHPIHGFGNAAHAHQMAEGLRAGGRQPEGKPVVGEVEDGIEMMAGLQGPAPEARQQGIDGDLHRCGARSVLPAGLGGAADLPEPSRPAGGWQP